MTGIPSRRSTFAFMGAAKTKHPPNVPYLVPPYYCCPYMQPSMPVACMIPERNISIQVERTRFEFLLQPQRGAALPGVHSLLFFRARISPESWSRRARRELCCSRSSATLASTRLSSRQTFSSSLSRRPLDLPAVMTPRAPSPPPSPLSASQFGLPDIFRSKDKRSWVLGGDARAQINTELI